MDRRLSRHVALPLVAAGAAHALGAPTLTYAQDAPCTLATPLATYEPSARAWVWSGKGTQVSTPIDLVPGIVYLTAEITADWLSRVKIMRYPSGDWLPGLDVWTDEPSYRATVADGIRDPEKIVIAVDSGGEWTITIEQPSGD
jgi:hypothetical protein